MKKITYKWTQFGQKQAPAGTRVRVMTPKTHKHMGDGALVKDYVSGCGMPVIELDNGRRVCGYQCWWLPVREALKMERKAERMKWRF